MRFINFLKIGSVPLITLTLFGQQAGTLEQQLLHGQTSFEKLGIANESSFDTALNAYNKINTQLAHLPSARQQASNEFALEALFKIGISNSDYQTDLIKFINDQLLSAYLALSKDKSQQVFMDTLERFLDLLKKELEKPKVSEELKIDFSILVESINRMIAQLTNTEKQRGPSQYVTILVSKIKNENDNTQFLKNFVHRYANSPALLMIVEIKEAYANALYKLIFAEESTNAIPTYEFRNLFYKSRLSSILETVTPRKELLDEAKKRLASLFVEARERFLGLMNPVASAIKQGNTQNVAKSFETLLNQLVDLRLRFAYSALPEIHESLTDLTLATNRLHLIMLDTKNPEDYLKKNPKIKRRDEQFDEKVAALIDKIDKTIRLAPMPAYRELRGILLEHNPLFYASYGLRNAYVRNMLELIKNKSAAFGNELSNVKERLKGLVRNGWRANEAFKINSNLYKEVMDL